MTEEPTQTEIVIMELETIINDLKNGWKLNEATVKKTVNHDDYVTRITGLNYDIQISLIPKR